MPYVMRNPAGEIVAVHRDTSAGATEFVAGDHAEVRAFLAVALTDSGDPVAAEFFRLDLDMIRVIDDLVDLLVAKGVVMFTELPAPAQKKFLARRSRREQIAQGNPVVPSDVIRL